MNEGLEKLRQEGINWVNANRSKRFSGVMKLFTEFYPDKTHFIYELLQNAEDARDKSKPGSCGASVVQFTLNMESLEFEHNGEGLFTIQDVESITGIGDSSKLDDPTSIGKFGIGFKAVFAYTDTPEIRSGEYHFRIRDLVVPEGIDQHQVREQKTLFRFPFDNPEKKKTADQAVSEISIGLRKLGDNTLLFLRCIRKIEYHLPDDTRGTQERIEHEGGHIEIRSSTPGNPEATSHWLRFEKIVKVQDDDEMSKDCRIAIAYRLEADDESKKEKVGWKIVPLDHGQVSIFFPAGNETSNLRFHLHAPFASTVARNSVRDCDANSQLRDRLADLVVESLASLRDRGLLDIGFLAVLPNTRDNLSGFYQPIRAAVVEAFRTEALTPTRGGAHQCAEDLYRGPGILQEVISDEDLSLLTGHKTPLWAKNPSQENQRAANFLADLSIDEWGWSELVGKLEECCWDEDERVPVETWIGSKDDAWLCRFNALLGEAQDGHGETIDVAGLRLVRVATNDGDVHVKAGAAFFSPADDATNGPDDVYFVKPATYASGRSESRKRYARSFLDSAGVRPFDEKAVIERTLALYQSGHSVSVKAHIKHVRQFIQYWKQKPVDASLFVGMQFLADSVNNGRVEETYAPSDLCLDLPLEKTDLIDAYAIHHKSPVWSGYQLELGVNASKDFLAFLKDVGVMHRLHIIRQSTWCRGRCEKLHEDYRTGIRQGNVTDDDYQIAHLDAYLGANSIPASHLVWRALLGADKEAAFAAYSPNSNFAPRSDDSWLVIQLKSHAWIPSKSGEFCKPQDMTIDDLRDNFRYDDRNGLLTAIGFGESAKKRSEEYQVGNRNAQALGFASIEEAEKFAKLKKEGVTVAELQAFLEQRKQTDQPKQSVPDPVRRHKNVLSDSEDSPNKESVLRERSIQQGVSEVTVQAKAYLRAKYKNADVQLVCQCCHKEMPFKLPRSGEHYFEAVQCIADREARHFQNRIALCPTCAAMYQYARETDDAELRRRIVEHTADDQVPAVEIPIILAGSERRLHFVGTHWFDLKTVLDERDVIVAVESGASHG